MNGLLVKMKLIPKPVDLSKAFPNDMGDIKAHEMISLVGLKGIEDSLPRDLLRGMVQRAAIE